MMAKRASLAKHTGFLTPAAQQRQQMQEAKNVDQTGMRRIPGNTVYDRDGNPWTVQAAHRATMVYDVTPVPREEYGAMGYVVRRVTDAQLDAQDFGFRIGGRLAMVDGVLTRTESRYT